MVDVQPGVLPGDLHEMTPWVSKYIGLPFEDCANGPDSFDCWGLVRFVMENEFGILLPDLSYDTSDKNRNRFVDQYRPFFTQLDKPQHGALVLYTPDRRRTHIGVCIDGTDMLHTMKYQGSVLMPLSSPRIKNGIFGYFVPNCS